MPTSSGPGAAQAADESEHGPPRPTLADREPTLRYVIVMDEAEKTVVIDFWLAGPDHRRRGDLIATGTIRGFEGPYWRLPKSTTSKDTDRINALPEEVRSDLFEMDGKVREILKAHTRQNAMRRIALRRRRRRQA